MRANRECEMKHEGELVRESIGREFCVGRKWEFMFVLLCARSRTRVRKRGVDGRKNKTSLLFHVEKYRGGNVSTHYLVEWEVEIWVWAAKRTEGLA